MAQKKKTTAKPKAESSKKASDPQFRTLPVRVEKHHIEDGDREHSTGCPVYLALEEQYPGKDWEVQEWKIHEYSKGKVFDLLPSVAMAIKNFDATGKMKPFQFNLVGYW